MYNKPIDINLNPKLNLMKLLSDFAKDFSKLEAAGQNDYMHVVHAVVTRLVDNAPAHKYEPNEHVYNWCREVLRHIIINYGRSIDAGGTMVFDSAISDRDY